MDELDALLGEVEEGLGMKPSSEYNLTNRGSMGQESVSPEGMDWGTLMEDLDFGFCSASNSSADLPTTLALQSRLQPQPEETLDVFDLEALELENELHEADAIIADLTSELQQSGISKPTVKNYEFSPWVAKRKDIHLGQKIGIGTLGVTYQGIWNQRRASVKVTNSQDIKDESFLETLYDQALLLHTLNCPRLSKFSAVCLDREIILLQEWVSGIPLFGLSQNKHNVIDLDWIFAVVTEIAEGMLYLHNNNIVHGNLKTKNVLVNRNQEIKINDYGMLCLKNRLFESDKENNTTCYYFAPEIFEGQPFSRKSDVYSFGMLLWELFARERPFLGINSYDEIKEAVVDKRQRPIIPVCPLVFHKLIESCWHADPLSRPTFEVIYSILSKPKEDLLKYDLITKNRVASAPTDMVGPPRMENRERKLESLSYDEKQLTPQEAQQLGKVKTIIQRILEKMHQSSLPDFRVKTFQVVIQLAENSTEEIDKMVIAESGIMDVIIQSCASDNKVVVENALRVIFSILDSSKAATILLHTPDCVTAVTRNLNSNNSYPCIIEALKIVNRFCENSENVGIVGEEGGIEGLVRLLGHESDVIKCQSCHALAKLLKQLSNHILFYQNNGVRPVLGLIQGQTNLPILMNALKVLARLTNNSKMESIVLQSKVLQEYKKLISPASSVLFKIQALKSISIFAKQSYELRAEMFSLGLISSILYFYKQKLDLATSQNIIFYASKFLATLSIDGAEHTVAVGEGEWVTITAFLKHQDPELREKVLCVVYWLLLHENNRVTIFEGDTLPLLISSIGNDSNLQNTGLNIFLILLKDKLPQIRRVLSVLGAITVACEVLEARCEDNEESFDEDMTEEELDKKLAQKYHMQAKAVCTLKELSFYEESLSVIRTHKAIPWILELAKTKEDWAKWLLGVDSQGSQIAGRNEASNRVIVDSECVDISTNATICICNLSQTEEAREEIIIREGMEFLLEELQEQSDEIVIERLLFAISHFAFDENTHLIIREMGLGKMFDILTSCKNVAIHFLILKIIIIMAHKSERSRQKLLSMDGIRFFNDFVITSNDPSVKKAVEKILLIIAPN